MRKTSYNGSEGQKTINKTMTVASNFKFQNLQRLNTIVGEVSQRNNKDIILKSNKVGMSDKVLDLIKNRIKTNYDKLYSNYDENKKTILKQMQHVETNMATENTVNKGFENLIKEKSNYDKSKADLEGKQKKLKKLMELRDQLKGVTNQNKEINEVFVEKCNLLQNLEGFKQVLDYQTAILNSMKSDRRSIKLHLKEKYDRMLTQQQLKKQKKRKLQNVNHNKKANLKRILQTLRKQAICEIPQNLAQELQRKLSQYEGKHIYDNIIKHEHIISEETRKKMEIQQEREKEQTKKKRIQKQKEQQKQYELAYNFFLIKQQEQEKIKKICGVSSLSEIVNNSLQSDFQNLELIKKEIQTSIENLKRENQSARDDISSILTGKQQYTEQNLFKAQQQFVQGQNQLRSVELNSVKKYELMNEWQSIVQLMCQRQANRQQLGMHVKQTLQKINNYQKDPLSRLSSKQKPSLQTLQVPFNIRQTDNKSRNKQHLREDKQSQSSITDSNLI